MLWVVEPLSHQPHLIGVSFHITKIQSKNDSESDSVSDEEDPEDPLAHKVLGTMH
jgi:hypothetical protein